MLFAIKLDSQHYDRRLPAYINLRKHLGELPSARQEVKALEKSFNGLFALDEMATEKMMKTKASSYAVIHLAMHGLLDSRRPLLSSLVFTEDGDSTENNFLHAYEISQMQLQADLVVLSACETGYGAFEEGNGIASLARSFMYAGVPALVVSLWQVNDQITTMIMKRLYANLAKGMDKATALQQAKLDYIRHNKAAFAHPAFWSSFIQIGNTKTIALTKKGSLKLWQLCLGLGIMGLIAFILLKRYNR